MNKLKATGVGVTGALIVLAVLMAMKAMPGIAASSSLFMPESSKGAGHAASSVPGRPAICTDCVTPAENGPSASGANHGSDTHVEAGTLVREEVQPGGASSGDSLAELPTIHAAGHGGTGGSNEVESNLQSSFVQAALGSGGLSGGRSAGNKDIAITADTKTNSNGEVTPGSGTTGGNDKEVLSSVGPGADDGVNAPQVHYCISPVGTYCGQESDNPNDISPLALSPPSQEIKPNPSHDPNVPEPESRSIQGEEQPLRNTPTEIPEPATVALIALGFAVVRMASQKTA